MYRLTIIAGPSRAQPARGSSYAVGNGTFGIGRHSQNQIVLQSNNVSKQHCVLVVNNEKVALEDRGSSNGTFVNGKLAAKRELLPGDRISVGEFVLELSEGGISNLPVAVKHERLAHHGLGDNVVAFPGGAPGVPSESSHSEGESEAPMPRDIVGKAKYFFDRLVLPYFYGFNERYEWRIVIGSLFAIYLVLTLVISLSPLMGEQERAIDRELSARAKVMAREIAERNATFLATKTESKIDLGTFERAEAVRVVAVLDLENRILAPSAKAGQYFELGSEASAAVRARKLFIDGRENGITLKSDPETIVAIEPIKVLDPTKGKNETRALAIVSIDTTIANVEGGQLWLVYAHSLVLSVAIGLFVFYLIYRITLRPLQEMNRKIDQCLRGENVEFKPSVYFSELDPLWDVMDSALKRVPRGEQIGGNSAAVNGITTNDLIGPLRTLGAHSKNGICVLDEERKILFMNSIFEEITGVRLDSSEGQPLSSVSRDQAFSSLVSDLCDRAAPGSEGISEDFDFSGMDYTVHVVSFGGFSDPKCFVFNLARKEG